MRGFSVIGCIVGVLLGLVVYAFLTAVLNIEHEDLIAGAAAVLLWIGCTFSWPSRDVP